MTIPFISHDLTSERVKEITAYNLVIKKDQITLDSSFSDDLGADSLDIVELIMMI